jgi:hypothetical protein
LDQCVLKQKNLFSCVVNVFFKSKEKAQLIKDSFIFDSNQRYLM